MQKSNNVHIENDKWLAPFLLAASFYKLVIFEGSTVKGRTLYWHFSPEETALSLIDKFKTKTEPRIPSKDLLEATEAFWQQVSAARNGGIPSGRSVT